MVLDMDVEQFPGGDEVRGDGDVLRAWLWVAAGMVVGEDDRDGLDDDRLAEDLSRPYADGVHSTAADWRD